MDREAWLTTVHGITESDTTEQLHFTIKTPIPFHVVALLPLCRAVTLNAFSCMIALGYAVVFIFIFLNDMWVDTAQLQMLIAPLFLTNTIIS